MPLSTTDAAHRGEFGPLTTLIGQRTPPVALGVVRQLGIPENSVTFTVQIIIATDGAS
jgi:hypothetical protein